MPSLHHTNTSKLHIHSITGKLVLLHLAENREDELATDVEQPWLGTALTDFEEPGIPTFHPSSSSTVPLTGSNGPLTSPRKANLVVTLLYSTLFTN
jgi:hypothetical protein